MPFYNIKITETFTSYFTIAADDLDTLMNQIENEDFYCDNVESSYSDGMPEKVLEYVRVNGSDKNLIEKRLLGYVT